MIPKPFSKYLFIVFISFCTLVASAATGGYISFYWCFFFSIIFYWLLTFFVLKKYGFKLGVIIALASPLLIEVYIRVKDFKDSLVSLPNFFALIIGIVTGMVLFKSTSKNIKTVYLSILSLSTAWVCFYGYPMYLHKFYYGTYTGRVSEPAPTYTFVDSTGNTYKKFDGITVLDFWTTRCGVCFEKFPQLQQLSNIYKNESGIKIYAANLPLDGDVPFQPFAELRERGYTFPVLKADELIDTTLKKFGFTGVPTVIILDNHNTIKYRGDIAGAEGTLKTLMKKE